MVQAGVQWPIGGEDEGIACCYLAHDGIFFHVRHNEVVSFAYLDLLRRRQDCFFPRENLDATFLVENCPLFTHMEHQKNKLACWVPLRHGVVN